MRARCENPGASSFQYYGARGIKVCPRWLSFENFLSDMGDGFAPGLSVERDDVEGDYEPGNCRWIPKNEQQKNTRRSRWLETPWGRMIVADAARRIGISNSTLRDRLEEGWEGDRLFAPNLKRA